MNTQEEREYQHHQQHLLIARQYRCLRVRNYGIIRDDVIAEYHAAIRQLLTAGAKLVDQREREEGHEPQRLHE